ncbi:Exosome complex exonuclease Rrp6-like protein [Abortiporus biennis]
MASSSANKSSSEPSLSSESFSDYNTKLQSIALKATKNSASLPSDIGFYKSLDRTLAREVERTSERVLGIANKLVGLAESGNIGQESGGQTKGKKRRRLEDDEDVVDEFRSCIVDVMDTLLEKTDICIDEFLGLLKPVTVNATSKATSNVSKSKKFSATPTPGGRLDPALQHASHLKKPQLAFKRKIDNSNNTIWRSTLQHKYNAKVPLGQYIYQEGEEENPAYQLHPYSYEIKHLQYPSRMFEYLEPIPFKSFEETPFDWVDSLPKFNSMLDQLRKAKEIAIDLEHHNYRTFSGFVCLMQISTREGDWIVDTLALRDELEELNEVFTDPDIVKVLHGAESDIVWLQQDFNLYIVNLFDTFHASKVLDFPRHGLATLLEMYCDFVPDKRYQLADWRIRPLPKEMLHYARSDTHFLLFVYDNLRNALLDRSQSQSRAQSRSHSPSASERPSPIALPVSAESLVKEVLRRSEETALRVYDKEIYDTEMGSGPGGWDTLARKWNKGAFMASASGENSRLNLYRSIHAWRDRIAREEDESTRYILSNHFVFQLAERPPGDMASFLAMFHSVPPVLRRRGKELLDVILDAVKTPASSTSAIPKEDAIHTPAERNDAMEVETTPVAAVSTSVDVFSGLSHGSSSVAQSAAAPTSRSSQLFGKSLETKTKTTSITQKTSQTFAASSSSLFVQGSSSAKLKPEVNRRFEDVISRIHQGLIIAPSIPKPTNVNSKVSAEKQQSSGSAEQPQAEQVEIPFVPVSQRQTKPVETQQDDTIIVVGQTTTARQKKRKRAAGGKTSGREEGGSTPKAQTPTATSGNEDGEAFDFNALPSVLDEGSDHESSTLDGGRKKKQKQKGQANYTYGDFRAPPKAHSQLKAGNQSRTFR